MVTKKKMVYYIIYPKNQKKSVKVVTIKPNQHDEMSGFAEGSFNTKKAVYKRLNWMDIPFDRRPVKFRKCLGVSL